MTWENCTGLHWRHWNSSDLHNFFSMFCFSQISINWVINCKKSNDFRFSTKLLITFTLSIHAKIYYQTNCLRVSYRLPKEVNPPPPLKMTRQICRFTVFGCHCWYECRFFPVMFHVNKNCLKLSFHWYQYLYACANLWKDRWHHIPVQLTSPFWTGFEKKLWSIFKPLLAHLSQRLKWAIVIAHRLPSVRPSSSVRPSVRKLSHFQLLLQNRLMDFDETW